MNCKTRCPSLIAKRNRAGFTLAEVLAAMLFLAIVIPVAVAALRLASLAGEVGSRKAVACRIADRVLNEAVVMRQLQKGYLSGTVHEGVLDYNWTVSVEPSGLDTLRTATAEVTFPAQGQDYSVSVTTLVDTSL